jgi:molecular chaperone HscB
MEKKMCEDDPALEKDLQAAKRHLISKQSEMLDELALVWNQWDVLVERTAAGESIEETERKAARDKMVDILNRRSYLRNLLREVDEVLES